MQYLLEIAIFLAGFIIITVASNQISKHFVRFKLPLITGLIFIGILCGPFILDLIPKAAVRRLNFVNEIALAFIAFAAGSELYLNEMRSRFTSIRMMTTAQFIVTFLLGGLATFLAADLIPFLKDFSFAGKAVIAMLAATIFIVPSPPAVIAVINEIRAKGPFTQTVMGVTVLKEFLVVILFAIVFSIAKAVIGNSAFDLYLIILLFVEVTLSFALGFILSKILKWIFSTNAALFIKGLLIILIGYSTFLLSHAIHDTSKEILGRELYIEPLLICIIASFIITNYSKYRRDFLKIIHDSGPAIYALFFTLIGASMELDVLFEFIWVTIFLFLVRVVSLIIGSFIGGLLSGDPAKYNIVSWMPYIPQAGVGIGLASVVGSQFPGWGDDFSTLMFGIIIISLVIGPPLLKWSINNVGEAHSRATTHEFDGTHDAIIFGLEDQSIALATQLQKHGWVVKIATRRKKFDENDPLAKNIDIHIIKDLDLEALQQLNAEKADAIITMNADGENYKICELAYEHYGIKDLIVRLNDRKNFDRFHELGCLIVEPSTAIVSLMDHLVRSPQATSLLLGMEENQDTIDIEVLNPDLHGISLRDLRLPKDVIILSTRRGGQMIISTGYTRLRIHDILTVVGSIESLEAVRLNFEG